MARYTSPELLKSAVAGAHKDVQKLRELNTKLRQQLASFDTRRYTPQHIADESRKLREQALSEARAYLTTRQTMDDLAALAAQKEHWSTAAYLARVASIPPNPSDTLKGVYALLRAAHVARVLQRAPLAQVAAQVEHALSDADWPLLAELHAEVLARAHAGETAAESLQKQIEALDVPAVTEVVGLLEEGEHLRQNLQRTLESMQSGGEDAGVRFDSYRSGDAAAIQREVSAALHPAAAPPTDTPGPSVVPPSAA